MKKGNGKSDGRESEESKGIESGGTARDVVSRIRRARARKGRTKEK